MYLWCCWYFSTENSEVEDLFRGAASHSKACLFLCDDVFGLRFESVQDDLQHDFAGVADKANCAIVLAQLNVPFLGECDYQ